MSIVVLSISDSRLYRGMQASPSMIEAVWKWNDCIRRLRTIAGRSSGTGIASRPTVRATTAGYPTRPAQSSSSHSSLGRGGVCDIPMRCCASASLPSAVTTVSSNTSALCPLPSACLASGSSTERGRRRCLHSMRASIIMSTQ